MNTIFMNSENNRTSDVHRLRFNLTDKIDLQRADDHVALSNLTTQGGIQKSCSQTINLKYQ